MDIVDALAARDGTTCVVGAGGKKTAMATLAGRLDEPVVTATVRIPIFDGWVVRVAVTGDPLAAVREADADDFPLGVVPERERADRYRGYDLETVDSLADTGHPVLVKADGARMREFKAPNETEPRLPTRADTVVPVASAHVVGERLDDESVHRVDRVAALTGLDSGDPIGPEDVARVLASPEGGRKGVPEGATVVPLVNKVDDAHLEGTAREIAEAVLTFTDEDEVPRVVLAELRAEDPLVAIVER
jgi:probable selenium-dependent hydroxylase accessory protein YqeC